MMFHGFARSTLRRGLILAAGVLSIIVPIRAASPFRETVIWGEHEGGFANHHVFGLTLTRKGTILAFSEARIDPKDEGAHDLVVKRSTDQGATWTDSSFVERANGNYWSKHGQAGKREDWTNPAALVDQHTGRIFYFYALNEGSVGGKNTQRYTRDFYKYSDDDGLTWSKRMDITGLLNSKADGTPNKDSQGKWVCDHNGFPCDRLGRAFHMPGPGHGIQLKNGRLIMQFWNRTAIGTNEGKPIPPEERNYGLSLIYSDDGGHVWHSGPSFGQELGCTESRIVQLDSGELYLNARLGQSVPRRGIMIGSANGLVWKMRGQDTAMPPYNATDSGLVKVHAGGGRQILLFSHPQDLNSRTGMTIDASLDEGKTWTLRKTLSGKSGYSDLVELPDGAIGLLYEKGFNPNEVVFVRFTLSWLGL